MCGNKEKKKNVYAADNEQVLSKFKVQEKNR
jgi:hypothetical protein